MKSPVKRSPKKVKSPKKAIKQTSKKTSCGIRGGQISADRELLEGLIMNKIDRVKKGIMMGSNVNLVVSEGHPLPYKTSPWYADRFDGLSALEVAIYQSNLPFVQLLLHHGANVNHRNQNNSTPLMLASIQRHRHWSNDVIDYLLSHGADPSIVNKFGYTASDYKKDSMISYTF